MRRSDDFWKGAIEAQRTVAFLVFLIVILGVVKDGARALWVYVPIAFGTFGTYLGVVYAARAYVDGRERNPDLHRALGERQERTGVNPTPPRDP